jgi:hypothetical protein
MNIGLAPTEVEGSHRVGQLPQKWTAPTELDSSQLRQAPTEQAISHRTGNRPQILEAPTDWSLWYLKGIIEAASIIAAAMIVAWTLLNVESGMIVW